MAILLNKCFVENGDWLTKRKPLHDDIIKKITEVESSQTNSVYMLGGGTANGKSTLVASKSLPYPDKIITVDADVIKGMIPEYKSMLSNLEIKAYVQMQLTLFTKKAVI